MKSNWQISESLKTTSLAFSLRQASQFAPFLWTFKLFGYVNIKRERHKWNQAPPPIQLSEYKVWSMAVLPLGQALLFLLLEDKAYASKSQLSATWRQTLLLATASLTSVYVLTYFWFLWWPLLPNLTFMDRYHSWDDCSPLSASCDLHALPITSG